MLALRKCVGLLCLVRFSALSADLPELVLPAGVGVNIHFTRGHEEDLDRIAAAGFKFVRMDFTWEGIEREQGDYDWSDYDELTANLERRGVRPLYILDYSNRLYEEPVASKNPVTGLEEKKDIASPQHPESVAAFARWAAAAARHYRRRRVIWEIWNEPNISFWKPRPDAAQYTTLALAACKAIREANPEATILAPATSEIPSKFLEEFFKSGALEHLDGVSVHPYRAYRRPPETAAEDYKKLRELIDRYTPAAKTNPIPIISGEWGYASHTSGVTLETQAAFIARQQLANLLSGIPLSIWYDWKNDGPDPNEREHNFGTVTHDLKPKPAYVALQTLTRELSGCRLVRRLEVGSDKDYVLSLADAAGGQKLAAWTLDEPHALVLEAGLTPKSNVTAVKGNGERYQPRLEQKRIVLELEVAPQYLALRGVKLLK